MIIRFGADGAKIAALQFEVVCGPALRNAPSEGSVVSAAGKALYVRWVGMPRRGAVVQHMRFLVVGVNGIALGDGIIASLPIRPGLTVANVRQVEFPNVVASDPAARPIAITARGWPDDSRSR